MAPGDPNHHNETMGTCVRVWLSVHSEMAQVSLPWQYLKNGPSGMACTAKVEVKELVGKHEGMDQLLHARIAYPAQDWPRWCAMATAVFSLVLVTGTSSPAHKWMMMIIIIAICFYVISQIASLFLWSSLCYFQVCTYFIWFSVLCHSLFKKINSGTMIILFLWSCSLEHLTSLYPTLKRLQTSVYLSLQTLFCSVHQSKSDFLRHFSNAQFSFPILVFCKFE